MWGKLFLSAIHVNIQKKGVFMFWEVVFDDKRKLSCIEGITQDDRDFTEKVYNLQQKGAPIRCQTPPQKNYTQNSLIDALNRMGYKYITDSILDYYESKLE